MEERRGERTMNEKKLEYLINYEYDINNIKTINNFSETLKSLAEHDVQFASEEDFMRNKQEIKLLLLKIVKMFDELIHLIYLLNCMYGRSKK